MTPATDCAAPTDFTARPTAPKAGSLFRIVTRAALVRRSSALSVPVADEPLHFRPVGDSAFAIAAVMGARSVVAAHSMAR